LKGEVVMMTVQQYLLFVFLVPCILQLLFGFLAKNRFLKFLPMLVFGILFVGSILEFLGIVHLHLPTTGGIISADALDYIMINALPIFLSLGVGALIVWAVQDKG
jgi:hypothetical protein